MPEQRWLPFAKLGRAHGLRGELRLNLYNPESEHLGEVDLVRLELAGQSMSTRVESVRGDRAKLLVRLAAIRSRDDAERWTNAELSVPEALFAPIEDDDAFYAWQLEGLEARDDAGRAVGVVRAVVNHGAGDILVVQSPRGLRELPFADPFVGEINLDEGWVCVELDWLDA